MFATEATCQAFQPQPLTGIIHWPPFGSTPTSRWEGHKSPAIRASEKGADFECLHRTCLFGNFLGSSLCFLLHSICRSYIGSGAESFGRVPAFASCCIPSAEATLVAELNPSARCAAHSNQTNNQYELSGIRILIALYSS